MSMDKIIPPHIRAILEEIEKLKKVEERARLKRQVLERKLAELGYKVSASDEKVSAVSQSLKVTEKEEQAATSVGSLTPRKSDDGVPPTENVGFVPKATEEQAKKFTQELKITAEDKKRAKQRFIERKQAEFEEMKQEAEAQIEFAKKIFLPALVIAIVFPIVQIFVEVLITKILLWVGAVIAVILAFIFGKVIYENDLKIARGALFEFDGEQIFFAYNWTKDPVRRVFLRVASYFNPEVKRVVKF